jgi:hypothetical protein
MSQETPQGLVVTTALEGLVFVYLEPGPVSEADLNGTFILEISDVTRFQSALQTGTTTSMLRLN